MTEKTNKLGKYILNELLGSGAFGWVYKATDPIGRTVAVKVLKPGWSDDPETLARFRREAQVAGELFHNRIATILDFDESDGRLFLVMRYVDGVALDKIIQQKGRLSWAQTLEILGQVAEGLDYAHQRGFVHRDIKPGNILVSEKEGAVLTDFGLVKAAEASGVSSSGAFLGTPHYIAPEIWSGKIATPATDVYSLACVAYEMLTGKVLFAGENTPEVLSKHVLAAPLLPERWPEDVPEGLNAALARALEKDPAQRCQTAPAFVADLKNLASVNQRQAEMREKARQTAQAESAEKARQEQERQNRQAAERSQPKENTSIARFWPVGLLLLGIIVAVFLFGKSLGGTSQVAPTPIVIIVTEKPTFAPPTEMNTSVPTSAPTNTPVPTSTSAPTNTPIPAPGMGSTQTRKRDGMVMVYVPEGPFTMGSEAYDDEKPIHTVTLDAFWMDQTEVTNAMFGKFAQAANYQTEAEKAGKSWVYNVTSKNWEEVLGANWQHPQGINSSLSGLGEHPVAHVSWNDASAYCAWAGGRLPTESEWEKAARGEQGFVYPWGNSFDGTRLNFADVNLNVDWADKTVDDGYQFTAPVGSYESGKSPYGAYDMAGNVWEWVEDWYAAYPGNTVSNSDYGTTYRVLRGGSWVGIVDYLRVSSRLWLVPSIRSNYVGFRCAR